MMQDALCEHCANFIFDDDSEEYICNVSLDEDEYLQFISSKAKRCPMYRDGDDYKIVRKQN